MLEALQPESCEGHSNGQKCQKIRCREIVARARGAKRRTRSGGCEAEDAIETIEIVCVLKVTIF